LDDLLAQIEACGNKLYALMPSRYHSQAALEDTIGAAWQRAGQAVVNNYQAVSALREQVAAKVARAERLNSRVQMDQD
jgi:hypothetical protein